MCVLGDKLDEISSELSDINVNKCQVLEDSILHIMATLLKRLPMDLIKYSYTYYSNYVNLVQDYVLPVYPLFTKCKQSYLDLQNPSINKGFMPI